MKTLFIFGTRPEAIKMAPIIKEFEKHPKVEVEVCITAQHREMLDQVLHFFEIVPNYDLDLMLPNQTLFDITAIALKKLEEVLTVSNPDMILVQGDTTTAFVGALAGFYKKIRIAHIEAGLRSGNLHSPFPEEANRKLIGALADVHFTPTERAYHNLKKERTKGTIFNVGNSVIDALLLGLEIIEKNNLSFYKEFPGIDFSKRLVLVTAHRRESFGQPYENICNAIKDIAQQHDNVEVVFPVHLNPNVREIVNKHLSNIPGIHLIEPLDYPRFIWLMSKSHLIITDSGGVQEEAPSLGKPVLVVRQETEREEGIEAGTAKLVATDRKNIVDEAGRLLSDAEAYATMANAINPYGDGTTSMQIAEIVMKTW